MNASRKTLINTLMALQSLSMTRFSYFLYSRFACYKTFDEKHAIKEKNIDKRKRKGYNMLKSA